jgi:hypothetical protein
MLDVLGINEMSFMRCYEISTMPNDMSRHDPWLSWLSYATCDLMILECVFSVVYDSHYDSLLTICNHVLCMVDYNTVLFHVHSISWLVSPYDGFRMTFSRWVLGYNSSRRFQLLAHEDSCRWLICNVAVNVTQLWQTFLNILCWWQ